MGDILIVEDDPSIRKLVRVNLVKRGYTVREAEDSHQAIALFQEAPADLVLLDLVLPGLSGVDVCSWIRARSDVPIIVLSARLEEELKVAALDAGADDYVTKPFGQEELLARVRAFLRRSYVSAKTNETKIQIGELSSILKRAASLWVRMTCTLPVRSMPSLPNWHTAWMPSLPMMNSLPGFGDQSIAGQIIIYIPISAVCVKKWGIMVNF